MFQTNKKCLIIGWGSIGTRHASILGEMGHTVCVVTRQEIASYPCFHSVQEAWEHTSYEYVVIANKTCDHYKTLLELVDLDYRGILLVEKPLFEKVYPIPEHHFQHIHVAYNLRFHPIIKDIRAMISTKAIYSIHAYVGQYLPDWRPGTNYQHSYSASRVQGGGALRDLSHELDYVTWLTGEWQCMTAVGGTLGDLGIESDDVFCVLMETTRCPMVVVQMNYLDRHSRRELILNVQGMSLKADLIANTLERNHECKQYHVERNDTYRKQHQAMLSGKLSHLCSFEQGMAVLELIESAEIASEKKLWIENSKYMS